MPHTTGRERTHTRAPFFSYLLSLLLLLMTTTTTQQQQQQQLTIAAQWADVAAVPFFALLLWYLLQVWTLRPLRVEEWLLLAFACVGLLLDTLFSVDFLRNRSSSFTSTPPPATRKTRAARERQ